MEHVKTILAFDGQRARPVTQTWRDAPPPCFTMGVKTELELRIMDRTGKPVDPFPPLEPGGDPVTFRFAVGEDFDPDTPAVYSTQEVERTGEGVFRIVLDNTRTPPMIRALGVSAFRDMGCELVGMKGGETWDNPSACIQFHAVFRNRIDSGDVPEPDPGKTFLTVENAGQYVITKAVLKTALRSIWDTPPRSVEETAGKLEALLGVLRSIANT